MSPRDQLPAAPYLLETNRSDSGDKPRRFAGAPYRRGLGQRPFVMPGRTRQASPPCGVVQVIPCATSTRRWLSRESSAEAKHRLDEDDKRQETDHGYAYRGDGFEDRAILGRAQHGGPVRQNQDV